MKAISIKQPWAWLIVHGPKDIENRRWYTYYRGPILIHASKHFDLAGYEALGFLGEKMPKPEEFQRGGIVGSASIIACVDEHPSRWFEGPLGFVLADRRPLDFIPLRGQLGLFEVPTCLVAGVIQ